MFITFEFLLKSHDLVKIEMAVSTRKEATDMAVFLESSDKVIAFKMSPVSPSDLGMKPNESWVKYRSAAFTVDDYNPLNTKEENEPLSKTVLKHALQFESHVKPCKYKSQALSGIR